MLVESAAERPVSDEPKAARLPRRDWIVLPLLSVVTLVLLGAIAEGVARLIWPSQEEDSCFVNDPVEGYRFKPHCVSRTKNAEGNWTTNVYNDCGFRGDSPCRTKPPGSFRLAVLGSSAAQGMFVPYEDTFAARAARQLEAFWGRKVDVQNLGVPNSSPLYAYRRLGAALATHPDALLLVITPFDVEQRIDPAALAQRDNPNWQLANPAASIHPGLYKRIQRSVTGSRAALMAQHFLFSDRERFLRFYLMYGDKAGFLRQPFTPAWRQRFENLDTIIGGMAGRLRAANVRFFVMAAPSRAEAALLSDQNRPAGTDPFAFGNRIAGLAAKHGAASIDLMDDFSRIPHSEDLFYVVDGHIKPDGQAVIARRLTDELRTCR